ncbi:deoxyribodipyrimidine photo-lyase [Psychrosphaera saromensis]|uniref:cryptochrome/photolyase family protein n=1 Tax=Psychrosphaera saromensis TaxID=716813 RepID=UPI000CF4F570|nr:FAD-binding domain-containing protein [Psychrosphaera saromensis]GHB59091.1 deoxyribodipyrimidine photo-lyase [Psychrosphaera saromensis]GLQ14249.1 deoxyribodipyrimidine photo-lyase [Psychrosphaera saromensis]
MILWFRNDLRTHDNPALQYFLANRPDPNSIKSKAIFFVCEKQWQQHDWSAIKIDLIKRHLELLTFELKQLDIQLDIVEVDDFAQQVEYLTELVTLSKDTLNKDGLNKDSLSEDGSSSFELVANQELEVNEQARDQALLNNGIKLTVFESDVIVPKGKVLNQSGEMYKVFTPFKRAWLKYVRDYGFDYFPKLINSDVSLSAVLPSTDDIAEYEGEKDSPLTSKLWPLANVIEHQVIPNFIQDKLAYYDEERDFPGIKATSGLSPYLAIGAVSPRYLLRLILNHYPDILMAPDLPLFTWINELIWRDFYRHLIFHNPRLCKHQSFNLKYQGAVWPHNPVLFKAWCDGKTGYPIVDAAMRQLNQTGWMHNRLRMIVASFLTKHLLIDWRHGEKYFMQTLIDGDLAANNGGWQWAASTGCDAQPYFRIFNPILQSKRFDPNGDFIRKYVPELVEVPAKEIHFPHGYIKKQNLDMYWPAIVDHKEAREAALSFYK